MAALTEMIEVSREEWGSKIPDWPAERTASDITGVEGHHGGSTDNRDAWEVLPNVQDFHVNGRGWRDMWYHIAISGEGMIFDGRGVMTKNSNRTDLTVLFVGNYMEKGPSALQMDALHEVRVSLAADGGGSGLTWHSQRDATACPGTHLADALENYLAGDPTLEDPDAPEYGMEFPAVSVLTHDSQPGYAIVHSDGGLATFGGFPYLGSKPEYEPGAADPVISAESVTTDDGFGYIFLTASGNVHAFGSTRYSGRTR